MSEYRVNLDIYNGPLDLLLYLIRRDEVDIYDIPIARITEQYVQYVEMIHEVDPDLAGEFMVMAASLLELKTRMLLPSPPPEEGGEQGASFDPRSELVRQLLEYKAFKDAADDLRTSADMQSRRFPRRPPLPQQDDAFIDLEDVQIWDLLDAFSKILNSIGQSRQHQVIYDDTPVELHAEDIMDRLQREGPLTFRKVFEGRTQRSEIVGMFIAMLELIRQKQIIISQDGIFGEIHLFINPNPPKERPADFAMTPHDEAATEGEQAAQPLAQSPAEDSADAADGSADTAPADQPQPPAPRRETVTDLAAEAATANGEYVSDAPVANGLADGPDGSVGSTDFGTNDATDDERNEDDADDSGTETQGTGA